MPITDGLTIKQRAFLAAYNVVGVVTWAAQAAGVTARAHYYWLDQPAYRAAFEEAAQEATDRLEEEARRRAIGFDRPVFINGRPVLDPRTGEIYLERQYSDRLLELLLRAKRPEVFGPSVTVDAWGPDCGPVEASHGTGPGAIAHSVPVEVRERVAERLAALGC